jgi:hypothetical protein
VRSRNDGVGCTLSVGREVKTEIPIESGLGDPFSTFRLHRCELKRQRADFANTLLCIMRFFCPGHIAPDANRGFDGAGSLLPPGPAARPCYTDRRRPKNDLNRRFLNVHYIFCGIALREDGFFSSKLANLSPQTDCVDRLTRR